MSSQPPVIGITCGTSSAAGATPRYGTNQAYVRAIAGAGGLPVLLVPGLGGDIARVVERMDAVLIPGGADVDPSRYGAERSQQVDYTDPDRDQLELAVIDQARHQGLPLLGICRGMQVINVAFGGTLYQDLETEREGSVRHRSPSELGRSHLEHDIQVRPGSWFAEAAGGTALLVNSLHHQAVRDVGPGLVVTATSEDGVVEGLETPDRQTVAIQCHTEELPGLAWARATFEAFIAAARL